MATPDNRSVTLATASSGPGAARLIKTVENCPGITYRARNYSLGDRDYCEFGLTRFCSVESPGMNIGRAFAAQNGMTLRSGSRTEWTYQTTHLVGIWLLALIMIVLPPLAAFQGLPGIAFTSAVVLLGSLALFPLKVQRLPLALSPATGARAKPPEEQHRDRWPHSLAWFAGFCLAAWYLGTIYARFG